MANTLSGWTTETVSLVLGQLPLQTYDSANVLTQNYLSSVGGWKPDTTTDPTGFGAPVDGSTSATAAATIVSNQLARMHHVTATVTVDLTMDILANLSAGQTDSAILTQISSIIQDTMITQLASTTMTLSGVTNVAGTVSADGATTATQRVDVETAITANTYQNDPRAIGVVKARSMFGLDNTWSVQSYYTEDNSEISIMVQKYTDTTFATIDSAVSRKYIMNIKADGYKTIGGIVLD